MASSILLRSRLFKKACFDAFSPFVDTGTMRNAHRILAKMKALLNDFDFEVERSVQTPSTTSNIAQFVSSNSNLIDTSSTSFRLFQLNICTKKSKLLKRAFKRQSSVVERKALSVNAKRIASKYLAVFKRQTR